MSLGLRRWRWLLVCAGLRKESFEGVLTKMGKFTVLLAVVVGFLLGLAAGLTRAPVFSVHEQFQPASIRAPGPDWMQPGDEQAVEIPALSVGHPNDKIKVAGVSVLATQFLPAEGLPPCEN